MTRTCELTLPRPLDQLFLVSQAFGEFALQFLIIYNISGEFKWCRNFLPTHHEFLEDFKDNLVSWNSVELKHWFELPTSITLLPDCMFTCCIFFTKCGHWKPVRRLSTLCFKCRLNKSLAFSGYTMSLGSCMYFESLPGLLIIWTGGVFVLLYMMPSASSFDSTAFAPASKPTFTGESTPLDLGFPLWQKMYTTNFDIATTQKINSSPTSTPFSITNSRHPRPNKTFCRVCSFEILTFTAHARGCSRTLSNTISWNLSPCSLMNWAGRSCKFQLKVSLTITSSMLGLSDTDWARAQAQACKFPGPNSNKICALTCA